MNIVTGRTGTPHVTSQQQRDIYSAIFGGENSVLNIGKCLKAELQSSNTIRIYDGVFVMQGCVASIAEGAYDDVKIANGTQNQKRIDLIVAKYKYDTGTGYESVNLEVIKGDVGSNSAEPTVPKGNIRQGSNEAYFPLYAVTLNGISIVSIEPKFETLKSKLTNQTILWEGACYMGDTEEHTIYLPDEKAISKQEHGAVFVWCEYDKSARRPRDTAWHYFFVPKSHVSFPQTIGTATRGIYMTDAFAGMYKYLYVEDQKIMGYNKNTSHGTMNGITYNSYDHVLRYIIGV